MEPIDEARARFRRLEPEDHDEAAAIAADAFSGNRFYEEALGFDPAAFAVYWDAFLSLALTDRRCRVFGALVGGCIVAVLVIGYHGFPSPGKGMRFMAALIRRMGLRRTLVYLRFITAYGRAMRRPSVDESREARGLWLMAGSHGRHPRIGAALARFVVAEVGREGKSLCTGFVDAGNGPLLAFYRRVGFHIGPRFPFSGNWAVIVEREEGVGA